MPSSEQITTYTQTPPSEEGLWLSRVNPGTGQVEYAKVDPGEIAQKYQIPFSPQFDPTVAATGFLSLVKKVSGWFWGLLNGIRLLIPEYIKSIIDHTFGALNDYARSVHADDYAKLKKVYIEELGLTNRCVTVAQWTYEHVPILSGFMFFYIYLYGQLAGLKADMALITTRTMQNLNKETPVNLPEPRDIYESVLKGYIDPKYIKETLDKLGLTEETKNVYAAVIKQLAPLDTVIENYWRGEISKSGLMKELARHGYDTDQQELLIKTIERIPPIPDIIRMAVREAFNDEMSSKFGHDEEFPSEVADWAARQGLPSHWARRYWRAHWELPSPMQGYEMFHRRIITESELDALLKMLDYPVGWRKNLMAMSYNPIPRVDIRRMYKAGVFDHVPGKSPEQVVYEKYLDLGYDKTNAQYMTDFTVKSSYEEEKGISVSAVIRMYTKGLMSERDARKQLSDLQLHEQDIDLLISEADLHIDDERIDAWISLARTKYITGTWKKADIISEAGKKKIPIISVDRLTETWDYEKQARYMRPTKADIIRLYKKGMYGTPDNAIRALCELGYDKEFARALIEEATEDIYYDIGLMYKMGQITNKSSAYQRLIEAGYTPEEANVWIDENWLSITGGKA